MLCVEIGNRVENARNMIMISGLSFNFTHKKFIYSKTAVDVSFSVKVLFPKDLGPILV